MGSYTVSEFVENLLKTDPSIQSFMLSAKMFPGKVVANECVKRGDLLLWKNYNNFMTQFSRSSFLDGSHLECFLAFFCLNFIVFYCKSTGIKRPSSLKEKFWICLCTTCITKLVGLMFMIIMLGNLCTTPNQPLF